jgi:hypothetical protein
MPIFIDLAGIQLSGSLPFYNFTTGGSIRDIGYSLEAALLVNLKINDRFSIMTLAQIANALKDPITSKYEREWGFDRIMFIASWRLK